MEGKMEERIHLVQKMLKKNYLLEDIADLTGISKEEISEIRDAMQQ